MGRTAAAHVASEGRRVPGASVVKCPVGGGVGAVVVDVLDVVVGRTVVVVAGAVVVVARAVVVVAAAVVVVAAAVVVVACTVVVVSCSVVVVGGSVVVVAAVVGGTVVVVAGADDTTWNVVAPSFQWMSDDQPAPNTPTLTTNAPTGMVLGTVQASRNVRVTPALNDC